MALWRLYYHLVWATKKRQPLITDQIQDHLYPYIIGKADSMNCIIHAIGGIEDHIHLIASIPPTLSIADFVQKIKGSSAYSMNHSNNPAISQFNWQEGYGVFSMGYKQIEQGIEYVENQKIHHQNQTLIPALEQAIADNDPPTRWQPS